MAQGTKLKKEDKLLYGQDSHVSKSILNGVEPGSYRCINTNPDKDIWVLTDKQREIVRDVGLAHISEIDYMRIDHALISGLVERWRPETNTFHLPTGEATVTLEDVAHIYGLPIDGIPVTGRTFPKSLVPEVCELLGIAPRPSKYTIGITIKFKWLEDNFKPSKKRSEVHKTRAYLFFLVSGQIFANSSGARGPAWHLELFREFKPYAWGPACLASLYRMLGRATRLLKGEDEGKEEDEGEEKPDSSKITLLKTLTGPLQLLQIWAYSRMSIGRCPAPCTSWKKDLQYPLFKTWELRLIDRNQVTNMKEIRRHINGLKEDGVIERICESDLNIPIQGTSMADVTMTDFSKSDFSIAQRKSAMKNRIKTPLNHDQHVYN